MSDAASHFSDDVPTNNYVVNFFLYGLCGSYFREQVRAAFRCRRGGPGEWSSGRQRQTRTSLLTTRASVMSDTINMNAYRSHPSHAPQLPSIQA